MFERIDLQNPDARDSAAAEYVLGTLTPEQKAQFEALLAFSPELQADVARWEEHLQVLHSQLQPVTPPARVWRAVKHATQPQRGFGWHSLTLWRGLTAVAFSAALALGILLTQQSEPLALQSDSVFVINNQQAQPAWILNASMDRRMIAIQTVQPVDPPHGKVCELWLVSRDKPPVSLGILPHSGVMKVEVAEPYRTWLMEAELVVSIEDRGGSPVGQPQGPIVSRGHWMPLSGSTRQL